MMAIAQTRGSGKQGADTAPTTEYSLIYRTSCQSPGAKGTAGAADLFYTEQVNAFVGPTCMDESSELGRLSFFWRKGVFSRSIRDGKLLDATVSCT